MIGTPHGIITSASQAFSWFALRPRKAIAHLPPCPAAPPDLPRNNALTYNSLQAVPPHTNPPDFFCS